MAARKSVGTDRIVAIPPHDGSGAPAVYAKARSNSSNAGTREEANVTLHALTPARRSTRSSDLKHRRRVWLLVGASAVTTLAVTVFLSQGHRYDFAAFYGDGAAWNRGSELYTRANLNPPSATVALFAPLARFSFAHAQIAWTIAGVVALFGSVRVVARELAWSPVQALTGAAMLLVTHAAYQVFAFGQVTWLLLWPATMAWAAYRHDRLPVAGAWFGILVAFKPTFAIAAVLLSWPVWVTAAGVSISISALAVSVTGWSAWQRWLETGRAVSWIEDPLSASAWGVFARFEGVSRLSDLSPASVLLVIVLGGWAVWRTMSVTRPDRRLVCAWLLHATIAPLGWIYYLPLAFGPVAGSWPRGAAARIGLALLCVPMGLIEPKPFPVLLGLTFPLALFCAWTAWTVPEKSTGHPLIAGNKALDL